MIKEGALEGKEPLSVGRFPLFEGQNDVAVFANKAPTARNKNSPTRKGGVAVPAAFERWKRDTR